MQSTIKDQLVTEISKAQGQDSDDADQMNTNEHNTQPDQKQATNKLPTSSIH